MLCYWKHWIQECSGLQLFGKSDLWMHYKRVFWASFTLKRWFTVYLLVPLLCCMNKKFNGVPIHGPRTILLMMVAVCLNACIVLEQPSSSFFEYYPRWRDFMQMLHHHGGLGTVACLNTHSPKFQPRCKSQPGLVCPSCWSQSHSWSSWMFSQKPWKSCRGCRWYTILPSWRYISCILMWSNVQELVQKSILPLLSWMVVWEEMEPSQHNKLAKINHIVSKQIEVYSPN